MYTNRKINLKKKIVSRTIYHHAAKKVANYLDILRGMDYFYKSS